MSNAIAQVVERPIGLQAVEKVTVLLLTMGKPFADRIIKNFDDREIRMLARAASTLPAVHPTVVEALVDELTQRLEKPNVLVGSSKEAEQLISGVVSEDQVSEIMSELDGTAPDRVWSKLGTVDDKKLAEFVATEEPQVAAMILSKLEVDKASAVLENIDVQRAADLNRRLLSLKPVSETAMRLVAERLGQELLGATEEGNEPNRHARLGAILNKLDRTQIVEIIGGIEQHDPDEARRVQQHVFTFEDLLTMDAEDRGRLFDTVPSEQVVLALREASAQLIEVILAALSPRSRRMVEAEIATPSKVPKKQIMDARRGIASLALSMAERQLIKLRPEGEAAPTA